MVFTHFLSLFFFITFWAMENPSSLPPLSSPKGVYSAVNQLCLLEELFWGTGVLYLSPVPAVPTYHYSVAQNHTYLLSHSAGG